MSEKDELIDGAKAVLKTNDNGGYTIPAEGLYPHQWLWDSCFIAIGLRHYDIDRAKSELMHLLRGQWNNGMLPHMIFSDDFAYATDRNVWRSWVSPYSPDDITTSGITQPPMLAEAVVRIGEKLKVHERRTWYNAIYPSLLKYHEWLYQERDPHQEGLALLIHPYESGLDSTPPWIVEMHKHSRPWWITLFEKTHADRLVNMFRRDTKHLPPGQRMKNIDALLYYDVVRRLRRKQYDTERILTRSLFAIEDLTFNCILIRANEHLRSIAKTLRQPVPEELELRMNKTVEALEQLWDPYSIQHFSRNFVTHKLIKVPTIAALMPLYAGSVSKERAKEVVALLHNEHLYGTAFPVPSVPANSDWFTEHGYWQGPSWINTNWLIIDGLKRYGFNDEAEALKEATLDMVKASGFYEYFSPHDASPAGAANFSWTAALTIDLLKQ